MKVHPAVFILLVFALSLPLTAQDPSTAPAQADAQIEEELQAMKFRLPLRVVGTVTDAQTGEPVKDFVVIPGTDHGRGNCRLDYRDLVLFAGGQYEWLNASPRESLFVRIEASGYAPVNSPVLSEQIVATFHAKLNKAPNITGTVKTPDGRPASGSQIALCGRRAELLMLNGEPLAGTTPSTIADSKGQFVLFPWDGDYGLMVMHETGCAVVPSQHLRRDTQIRLQSWGRIDGVLTFDGKPRDGQVVMIDWRTDPFDAPCRMARSHNATTDENGRFTFERLPADWGKIGWEFAGRRNMIGGLRNGTVFQLQAGQTLRIELDADRDQKRTRKIVGRIAIDGGLPAGCGISRYGLARGERDHLQPVDAYTLQFQFSDAFHVYDVMPGEYWVRIHLTRLEDNRSAPDLVFISEKPIVVQPPDESDRKQPLNVGVIRLKPWAAP